MARTFIYHLCRQRDWERALERGVYEGSDTDRSHGFIHFSSRELIEESAAKHRAGEPDLLLLAVDAEALGEDIRWEPSASGRLYPHLYGRLPVEHVVKVHDLPLDKEGRHRFPPLDE